MAFLAWLLSRELTHPAKLQDQLGTDMASPDLPVENSAGNDGQLIATEGLCLSL